MEAAKHIEIQTNMLSESKNLKEEKKYIINTENKDYNLYLKNYTSFILIYCFYKLEDHKYEFEKKYLLEQFKNNKYLGICDSIDDVYAQLKIEFDKNNTNIKENNEDISIIIPINYIKIKDITFILQKKIKTEKESIEDLKDEVLSLKRENNFLKSSYEELKKENRIINDKLLNLEKDNKILFEKISKLVNFLENINKSNLEPINDTIILNAKAEKQKTLADWIKQKTFQNEIKFDLIFRKSVNGSH